MVGEQVDVGVDVIGAGLAEGEDPDGDPRVRRRDGDVDRRPVADRLVARLGRIGIEDRREEDRGALGVELEDFGGVRRESEAVIRSPLADIRRAALEHRDVEGIDADRHEDLRAGGLEPDRVQRRGDRRIRLADQPLEGPVAALLDL